MPRQRQLLAAIGAGERELPVLARETLDELHNRLRTLDTRILVYDRKIAALARQSEPAHDDRGHRPGYRYGAGDQRGRSQGIQERPQICRLAGANPRQNSSGGKTRLGAISKRGHAGYALH